MKTQPCFFKRIRRLCRRLLPTYDFGSVLRHINRRVRESEGEIQLIHHHQDISGLYLYMVINQPLKRMYVMHEIHHISGFCRLLKLDTLHRYLEMFHGNFLPLYVLFEVFGEVCVLSLKSFSCWCLFSIREACFYVCLVVHGALNLD